MSSLFFHDLGFALLSQAKLTGLLSAFFSSPDGIADRAVAETRWTDAYHSYAQDAVDASGDSVVTVNKAGFLGTLNLRGEQSSASAAANFDQAFVSYWTGGIFAIGKLVVVPPPGCPSIGGTTIWASEITSLVVSVIPNVLSGLLLPIFERTDSSDTALSKASEIARAFHTATTTAVIVTIAGLDTTPGPVGPLPIVNTCTLR